MSFCEHCAGQRFDRARVLRALRTTRKNLREQGRSRHVDAALVAAIKAVRALDIPHFDYPDEVVDGQTIH
jgi:hypothetical protein